MDDPACLDRLNEQFARNLEALQTFQPALAGRLQNFPIPNDVRLVTARDGVHTYLVCDGTGREHWLGGSSMPSISSEELFGRWQPVGGSVVLSRILTGREVQVIVSQLEPHCALFVTEPDLRAITLAFRLCDFEELLTSGRLVLLPMAEDASDLEESLVDFFCRHPGYEIPLHILTIPHLGPAQASQFQRSMERAAARVQAVHAQSIQRHVESLARACGVLRPGASVSRVALLSTAAGAHSIERGARIVRGLQALGIQTVECVPDRPCRCHLAARLQAITDACPDVILFSECHPGQSRQLLPDFLPILSWNSAGVASIRPIEYRIGPADWFVAESPRVAADLLRAGVPESRLLRISPGADTAGVCAVGEGFTPIVSGVKRSSVVVWFDLPDDSAEAADVALTSHLALWQSLQAIVRQTAAEYRESQAELILQQAEKQSGVPIGEPRLREAFINVLRTRIAPCAVALATVESLSKSGFELRAYGHGWSTRLSASVAAGPVPHGRWRFEALAQAQWLILPIAAAASTELILDALLAGCRVAVRAGQAAWTSTQPDLAEFEPLVETYRNLRELKMHLAKQSLPTAAGRQRPANLVAEGHTMAHRLRAVLAKATACAESVRSADTAVGALSS